MRDENEVLERFRQQYAKQLKKRETEYLGQGFLNCRFNARHRVKNNGRIGFCHNPDVIEKSAQFIVVCNDDDAARKCTCFECKHTKESVKTDMDEVLKNPAQCGKEYPRLAVLLWFLQRNADERTTKLGRLWRLVSGILSFRWW